MTGALALLFLLAVTLAIVRVAGVALRLTGLPQSVARFQATSALTGTGFTTSEAEGTMHHPVRRRILTLLMFAGHLGLVSLTSTVILTMTATQSSHGAFIQILAMLLAVGAICALAMSAKLDQIMCAWVAVVLRRLGWVSTLPYEILYENPEGYQLGAHIVTDQTEVGPKMRLVSHNGATWLSHGSAVLSKGDRVVLYAKQQNHLDWGNSPATKPRGRAS